MRLPIRCGASLPFWVALTAAAGVLTACSSGGVSGESPPPVICGVNLAGGDVLPQIVNATSGDQDLHVQTVPAVVFLRFTGNCDSGVALNFVPAGSVTVVSSAIANDSR